MKHLLQPTFTLALTVALFNLAVPLEAQEDNTPASGFTALFNGKDLSGWHGYHAHAKPPKAAEEDETKKHWRVDSGEIVNDGHGPYLTTEKEYGDIELWIDYKMHPTADSGVYLRGSPQVQIWDHTKRGGSGGLFNNQKGPKDPLVTADNPAGQWNRFRIRQIGERTSVWLNDKLVVDKVIMENFWDRNKPLPTTGPIMLQTHGGEIRWRNVFAREIKPDQANQLLRGASDPEGFESVFDGKSLNGWSGAVDNYEVKDGAIMCKPRKGGTLFTEEEYGDFVVRLEFSLPPGGNNGLAIRYPGGQVDSAYHGMCELQVLDNKDKKYAGRLDPRQSHGSAYGMAAAHIGYLRKPGQWNYQEVTVKGSTIKVELNGTVILDTDLSKVTEYLGDRPHPGKERESGHFGFAGHSDPVKFRRVSIKRLD